MSEVAQKTQVLIVGTGAGGAVTAIELASRGVDVLLVEEGKRHTVDDYGDSATAAMARLYRGRGMTPIMGSVPIGYVEGRCLGGSTEINSGFWHRTPPEILLRWKAQYGLADSSPEELAPHFEWAEEMTKVSLSEKGWPPSTEVFAKGIDAMGWSAQEVPRTAHHCEHKNECAHGCPTGAKQGMSRSLIPLAEEAGAKVLTRCRVKLLLKRRGRIAGVLAARVRDGGTQELIRIYAEHVFLCAGPTETPALLRRSGMKFHVGDSLRIHPMLKIATLFPEEMNSQGSVLPLLQVKEFWPEVSMGGAFFSAGHLAMGLSENWPDTRNRMADHRRMAIYYTAVRGTGKGSVRPSMFGDSTHIRYELSSDDLKHLSQGLGRLSTLLLAAGAEEIYPSVFGVPVIRREIEAVHWLDEMLPRSGLSLTTVHAFSACPIGERMDRCAADSFGKLHHFDNVYVNDASMLPDSPGVNPQGSIMALARRNAIRFADGVR